MSHSGLPGSDDETDDRPRIEGSRGAPTAPGRPGAFRGDLCVAVRPV